MSRSSSSAAMCSASMCPLRVKTANPRCADLSIFRVMVIGGVLRIKSIRLPAPRPSEVQSCGHLQITENK